VEDLGWRKGPNEGGRLNEDWIDTDTIYYKINRRARKIPDNNERRKLAVQGTHYIFEENETTYIEGGE